MSPQFLQVEAGLMKKIIMLLSVSLMLVLCGCAQSYIIQMTNGTRITSANKPKLKNGTYVFKDALGNESSVPAGRVQQISPASQSKEEKSPFIPTPSH